MKYKLYIFLPGYLKAQYRNPLQPVVHESGYGDANMVSTWSPSRALGDKGLD